MKEKAKRRLGLITAGVSGLLNGLLGTGGGMVMLLTLTRLYPDKEKKMVAISTACALIFSIMSMILYIVGGHMRGVDLVPLLLPSLLGGALGAFLLGRVGGRLLHGILALLLLLGGVRLLFG